MTIDSPPQQRLRIKNPRKLPPHSQSQSKKDAESGDESFHEDRNDEENT